MRIMIFGRPGSGKSTFALALAKKLNLPLHHLDKHFFVADWINRDYEEYLAVEEDLVSQDRWIIDGNALRSLHLRYERADVCIYFLYPRWICLLRLIKRLFKKDPAIKDRAEGCKEALRWILLKYMWTFEYRKNNRLNQQLEMLRSVYPQVKFYTVRNDQGLERVMALIIEQGLKLCPF